MTNPLTKNRFSAIWRVLLLLRATGNRTATASEPPRELIRHESAEPRLSNRRREDVGGEGQDDQEQDGVKYEEKKEFLAGEVLLSRSVRKASRSDVSGVADADLSGGPVEAVPDRHVRVAGVLGPAVEERLQQEPRSAQKPRQAPHHQHGTPIISIGVAYDDRLLGLGPEPVEKPKQPPSSSAEQEQRRGDVRLPARGWRNGGTPPQPRTPARGGRTGSERSAVAELSSRRRTWVGSCSAPDERLTSIPDGRVCGYSGGACERQGSSQGALDEDGVDTSQYVEGIGDSEDLVDFDAYQEGGPCKYQGMFYYALPTNNRNKCRMACDSIANCNHYAHGINIDDDANWCMLFNACPTAAPGSASDSHWLAASTSNYPIEAKVYSCSGSCSLTTCAASSGWKDQCHKAGLTCGASCGEEQCCDPILDCSIEYGTDAQCAAASSGSPPILQWEINGVAVQRSKVQVEGCCQGMTQHSTSGEAVYKCEGNMHNWALASTEDTVEPSNHDAITSAKIRFSMNSPDATAFCVVLRSSDGKDFLLGMDG
eukprot:CAMPEP_0178988934 /NCGR_PEP_ID=MMETSP0795-20121207/4074_1 /TAXON_ID=88552 /ORGANISM="Amoebophrya sp., Strain Ameob2" /LENGTH=540 /DNA_ID=CAMNT_0020680239 /DNA_START=100 /DNA_END=1719 /DNA_ORIENTATION=+